MKITNFNKIFFRVTVSDVHTKGLTSHKKNLHLKVHGISEQKIAQNGDNEKF